MEQIDYFNIKALSASQVNTYLNKSPYHFWKQTPYNEKAESFEPTASMKFGTLCHLLLLENDKFQDKYSVAPKCDRRTKEGKAIWDAFIAESAGKEVVSEDDFIKATNMMEALKGHQSALKLVSKGYSESEVYFDLFDMPYKAKLDYARDGLIIDYKTTQDASPEGFMRSVAQYGYHRQDYIYRQAYKAKNGKDAVGMIFIVQDVNEPEAIGIYNLDDITRETAEAEVRTATAQIKDRLAKGEWEFTSKLVQSISLPNWYQSKAAI